jgi:8-oxo-dGTP pyrophosphatase MutT (NUDIX family)
MDIARIEACLGRFAAGTAPRGDGDLNPGMTPARMPLTPAAILIPLLARDGGLSVILTRRTAHMRDHGGQIAFPGGRADPGDTDPVDTALRETEEEVNLPRDRVRVLGRLAPYVTRTGYDVTPIVGEVRGPIDLRPEPFEVEEIFEVPLAFLLDRANHQRHTRELAGVRREFYAMPYGAYYIWGATAGMIVSLVDLLDPAPPDVERA